MIQSFLLAWKNAFNFKGKTSRKDLWFHTLANIILGIILRFTKSLSINLSIYYVDSSLSFAIFAVINQIIGIIYAFYILGSIIVGLSIQVRRLNDISKKWVWIFIQIIPIFGSIYFIYLMCQPSISANSQEK